MERMINMRTQNLKNNRENTISFKMTDNTTELIDGDFWNRDVKLRLYWADGTVSEKTLHFLQM